MNEKTFRIILASGYTVDVSPTFVEPLKAAIADASIRWEPYLVNEDGPYVVPAHVVAIEILHGEGGMLSARAVATASMDLDELVEPGA